jgi:hypothetical protein
MTELPSAEVLITVGVDTHADVHVAAALDKLGLLLETHSLPTAPSFGLRRAVRFAPPHG